MQSVYSSLYPSTTISLVLLKAGGGDKFGSGEGGLTSQKNIQKRVSHVYFLIIFVLPPPPPLTKFLEAGYASECTLKESFS